MNSRKERLDNIVPAYDVTDPPEGTRLQLGVVAARLQITITDLADATELSRRTVGRLLTNEWPQRADRKALKAALTALFERRGASKEELATLFHARGNGRAAISGPTHLDNYGRPHGYVPRSAAAPSTPDEEETMLARQALTPAAKRHFKLFKNPFEGDVLDDSQMFVGDDIAYVREAAWQCAMTGGFAAICGESGAGKTTILADLSERLKREARDVVIIRPSVLGMEENDTKGKTLKSADILHAICTELDPSHAVPQTLQARTVRAQKLLAGGVQTGNSYLLVVEEAHSMPDATLKHLKRLHELRDGRKSLLGILLLAQPELKVRLAAGLRSGALREVSQRCEVVELLPLDDELRAYLERRAAGVNVQLGSIVDADAVEQLRSRMTRKVGDRAISMCYPLAVNNMMTKALNTAAELGVPRVTRELIAAL